MSEKENHLCPACGTVLYGRSCKLRCKKCGFFEDCSDGVGANMNYEIVRHGGSAQWRKKDERD